MALDAHADQLSSAPQARTGRGRSLATRGLVAARRLIASPWSALLDDDGKPSAVSSQAARRTTSRSTIRVLATALAKELDKLPGSPLAVVRRKDGKGLVVLRREGRAPKSFSAFSADLTKALDKRIPDFQKRSSKMIEISAGKAFFFSYIRKTKGTVHTVVVVPDGRRSYVLNTVSQRRRRERRAPGRTHHPLVQGLAPATGAQLVQPLEHGRQVAQEAR